MGNDSTNDPTDDDTESDDEPSLVSTRPRFAPIPQEMLFDPEMSGDAVKLWGILDRIAARERIFPGRAKLATIMGCSEDTIDRRLGELKNAGWLDARRRGLGRTNVYTLHDRPRTQESAHQPTPESATVRTQESAPERHYREEGYREEGYREEGLQNPPTPQATRQGTALLDEEAAPPPGIEEDPEDLHLFAETDRGTGESAAPPETAKARRERETKEIAKRVFDVWCVATNRNARTALDAKRLAKVKARLAEGFDEEELIEAVQGITLSKFHCGDNETGTKYLDMTVALRDAGQVEKFRDLWRRGGDQRKSKMETVAESLDEKLPDDYQPGFILGFGDDRGNVSAPSTRPPLHAIGGGR